MEVEKGAHFARRRMRKTGMQALQLVLYRGHRGFEARRFSRNLRWRYQIVRNIQRHRSDQVGAADGDAARYANAVQGE